MSGESGVPRAVGGSRRPDGTLRKTVAVRDGFRSEELDAAARAYQPCGTRVPPPDSATSASSSAAAARAEKRRRKAAAKAEAWSAAGGRGSPPADTDEIASTVPEESSGPEVAAVADQLAHTDPAAVTPSSATLHSMDADPNKQLKALQKRLRQVKKLQADQAAGKSLSPDEAAKLERKSMLEDDIRNLTLVIQYSQ